MAEPVESFVGTAMSLPTPKLIMAYLLQKRKSPREAGWGSGT
jgi:hypothetical protein